VEDHQLTIGLNISGGEFGGTAGTHGYDYRYPTLSDLQFYKSHGVDLIRVPFRWERVQDALGGPLDLSGDVALIKQMLVNAASLGMDVILDAHNYGRYKGVALGAAGGPTAAQFADFWKKMASELKDYPALLGYDLMNEPHDMPNATIWKQSAQAATDAIRQVDMNNIIYVEGEGWSAAHTWLHHNSNLIIKDPANKIVYQAHGYYDDNNSGTYNESYEGEAAYPMVGVDRLKPFVEWLKANNLKGMVGEFGVPSNDPRWLEVQKNALDYMNANNLDGTAWGGGVWIGTDYKMYTARPGHADSNYMNLLERYFGEYKDVLGSTPPPPTSSGAPTIAVNDVSAKEGGSALVFTVTRSGDLSKASAVNFATANATAVAGSDYTAAQGTLNFAAGQATATVTVQVTNDTLVENAETLKLNLTGGTNVSIADGSGTGTINSEDGATVAPPPTGFPTAPTISGTEGNDSINAGASTVDFVNAKGGNDTITGVGSKDYIDGGAGTDAVSYHWSGAYVNVDLARATQSNGDANGDVLVNIENITGSGHNDFLRGDGLANVINGAGGEDVLSGGNGADTLTGGSGNDRFVFENADGANGDKVSDFALGDKLDFRSIDASATLVGDQAFTWLDTGGFTGSAGQLREYDLNGIHYVAGDLNGDKVADFTIQVLGKADLNSADILL
jgi:aryl-phospho-beta-D-glucosidase BglC (GH1 family)